MKRGPTGLVVGMLQVMGAAKYITLAVNNHKGHRGAKIYTLVVVERVSY